MYTQEPQKVWELYEPANGNKTYVARDGITLKEGFEYNATSGNAFHAYLDENLSFIPTGLNSATINPVINNGKQTNVLVGATNGNFEVSPMGAATYSIPIVASSGVNGFTPQISLSYDSNGGNGIAGWGFNIGGVSVITRVPHSTYYDGQTKGIDFTGSNQAFALDGKRLILLSGSSGSNESKYCLEEENFSSITLKQGVNKFFEIITQDGTLYRYGSKLTSFAISGSHIFNWYLDYIQDINGNYISYEYEFDSPNLVNYLKKITYGSNINKETTELNTIELLYEKREDTLISHFYQYKMTVNKRLMKILSKINGSQFRVYDINYKQYNGLSFISQVKESGYNNESYSPTLFTWNHVSRGVENLISEDVISDFITTSPSETDYIPIDINKDGLTDIISIYKTKEGSAGSSTLSFYNAAMHLASVDGSGRANFSPDAGTPFFSEYYEANKKRNDFNHIAGYFQFDLGKDRFLLIPSYNNTGEGYFRFYATKRLSDGRIIFDNNGVESASGNGTSGIVLLENSQNAPLFRIGDFNSDGNGQFLYIQKENRGGFYSQYYPGGIVSFTNDDGKLQVQEDTFQSIIFRLNSSPLKIDMADFNSDGLVDIIIFTETGYHIYYNRGISPSFSSDYSQTAESTDFSGSYYTTELGDFNGDGIPDYILRESANSAFKLALGNGNGTFSIYNLTLSTWDTSNQTEDGDNMQKYNLSLVTDFDNDGKSDILISIYDGKADICMKLWYLSNGAFDSNGGYFSTERSNKIVAQNNARIAANVKYFLTGDFNGDGFVDIINYGPSCYKINSPAKGELAWRLYQNKSSYLVNRIKTIQNGLDQKLEIEYSPMSDRTIYTPQKTAQYPILEINNLPVGLVSSIKENATFSSTSPFQKTSYKYSGMKAHYLKGLIGFSENEIKKHDFNEIQKTTYTKYKNYYSTNSQFYYPELLKTEIIKLNPTFPYNDEILVSESEFTNNTRVIDLAKKIYFPYIEKQIEKDKANNTTTTTSFSDYQYGKPRIVNTDYGNNLKKGVVMTYNEKGLPTSTVTTSSIGDGLLWIDKSVVNYEKNKVKEKIDYTNNGTKQTSFSNNEYDLYGNLISQSQTPFNSLQSYTTRYTYSSNGKYLLSETDFRGNKIEYKYDTNKDLLIWKHDHNSDESQIYEYDGLGSVIIVRDGNTNILKQTKLAVESRNRKYSYFVTNTGDEAPTTRSYINEFGKEVLSEEILSTGYSRFTERVYDNEGRLRREYEPYDYKTSELRSKYYNYDIYGRIQNVEDYITNNIVEYNYGSSNMVSETKNGVKTTRKYNVIGQLIEVEDPAGKTYYTYRPDGQPELIKTIGGIITSFKYDDYGRQISILDPNAGTFSYSFDDRGNNTSTKDGNGKLTIMEYDDFDRLVKKSVNNEESFNYTYDARGNLVSVISNNGVNWKYSYNRDNLLKSSAQSIDNVSFKTSFNYTKTKNLASASYTTKDGNIVTENYKYTLGYLTDVSLSTGDNIFSEKTLYPGSGLLHEAKTGNFTRKYYYNQYFFPEKREVYIDENNKKSSLQYEFNPSTKNLESRIDHVNSMTESFSYDGLNRLTQASNNKNSDAAFDMSYYENGNIKSLSGVGDFKYGSKRPYAIDTLSLSDRASSTYPNICHRIDYNGMNRPTYFENDSYSAQLKYDDGGFRTKMTLRSIANGSTISEKFYFANKYETDSRTGAYFSEWIFLNGDAYSAPAVYAKRNDKWNIYYIVRDYLGSINQVLAKDGTILQDLRYNPWGRVCEVDNYELTAIGEEPQLILGRGFTGHEHLPEFGLINMNARLYDSFLGRFLAVDPYVQMPDFSQNFNRYTYALNNPLSYTDENGEMFGAILGSIGGFIRGITRFARGENITDIFTYTWKGAANGFKIDWGLWKGSPKQIISRFTNELPQTIAGNLYSTYRNTIGHVDKVRYFDGATYVINSSSEKKNGVSLGSYININIRVPYHSSIMEPNGKTNFNPAHITDNGLSYLFMHEYGHYIQSQKIGLCYLFNIGIPSISSADESAVIGSKINPATGESINRTTHSIFWTETTANDEAARYFGSKYNVLWESALESYSYPLTNRSKYSSGANSSSSGRRGFH